MSAFRIDGGFTTAEKVGKPRLSYPIPRDTTALVIEQDFMQLFANYTAPTLASVHSDFTAYLIQDSPLQDLGGGVARWTRTWASIPANRYDYGTFDYEYIGLITSTSPTPPFNSQWDLDPSGGRDPQVRFANSKILNEYFLCSSGQTYTTPDDIPVVSRQTYCLTTNPEAQLKYLFPAGVYYADSSPTTEEYQAMIAAGDFIVAEDSRLDNYMGKIFVRQTRYVKAL